MEDKSKNSFIDSLDKHRVLTRLIIIVITCVFAYSFILPLGVEYVKIASYVIVTIFIATTFGINSLDKIIDLIKAMKGK